jgi:hypothetical protein
LVEQKSLSAVRERESSLSEMSPSSNQPKLSNSASSTLSRPRSLCAENPQVYVTLAYRGFLGVWLEMLGILFLCRAYKRVGFWRGLEMFIFSGGLGCNYMRCLVNKVFPLEKLLKPFELKYIFIEFDFYMKIIYS